MTDERREWPNPWVPAIRRAAKVTLWSAGVFVTCVGVHLSSVALVCLGIVDLAAAGVWIVTDWRED